MSSWNQNFQGQMVSENVVIIVMGITGTGKSRFIKTLSGREDIEIGDSLESGK